MSAVRLISYVSRSDLLPTSRPSAELYYFTTLEVVVNSGPK